MAQKTTNTAWTVPKTATTLSHLTKQHRPIPTPGPNQVLVRLTAASLNYRDILIAVHNPEYPGPHKDGVVLGSDAAGVIHSAHPTSKWANKVGTKVILHPCAWESGDVRNFDLKKGVYGAVNEDGTLQEYKLEVDSKVVEVGDALSLAEWACLASAGVTAWCAIRDGMDGRLDGGQDAYKGSFKERRLEGKTVLTQGTGGTSCFAIQIASALGATVIATSSSDAKLALAKSLGATHTINYVTTPNWDEEVLRLTNGVGVDQVIENGGSTTLLRSIKSTRMGGLISGVGFLGGMDKLPEETWATMLFRAVVIKGCLGFSCDSTVELVQFMQEHGIKPVIAKTFDFDHAVEALEALKGQKEVGKIVVNVAKE